MTETTSTYAATTDLREAARHVMVDFNQMRTFTSDPLIMVEGSGIRLTDHEGRSYIDGLSGVFAVSLGHGNEEIIDAITAQHRRLTFSSPIMTTTDRALELAGELIRLTGGRFDVVKQMSSGSEATEAAIKMARQYHRQSGSPERYKTISFYRSYHGATMGALTQTGWSQLRTPYEPFLTGGLHTHPPIPSTCRACAGSCTLNCLAQLRDVIESEGRKTVSAVIVEPVMLTAGVHPLSGEYLEGLRAICDETGVLLIFDEIVTGFGRLGSWFAAEQVGVWPDILCVGKGLTSGYAPLSAVLLSERVGSAFWGDAAKGLQYQAGHTFAGNPVSAACGLAVIRYFEEHGVLDNVRERGAELEARLRAIAERHPIAGELRGRGLLYCIEFVDPEGGGALAPEQPVGTAVQQAARRRGLLVRASPHNATLAPPLVVTATEVTEIADIFEESIAEVGEQVAAGGGVRLDVAFGL
ncbi:MAG: aspartate aminotransferase family protein [Gaiellales bacterium]